MSDQLTAFCVTDDQERQRQVLDQIGPHTPAYAIRRAMTKHLAVGFGQGEILRVLYLGPVKPNRYCVPAVVSRTEPSPPRKNRMAEPVTSTRPARLVA